MRLLRLVGAGLGVVALILFLLFYTRVRDTAEGALCRSEYARARSAAESSIVDAHLPQRERGGAENTGPIPTCGELRKLGRT